MSERATVTFQLYFTSGRQGVIRLALHCSVCGFMRKDLDGSTLEQLQRAQERHYTSHGHALQMSRRAELKAALEGRKQ